MKRFMSRNFIVKLIKMFAVIVCLLKTVKIIFIFDMKTISKKLYEKVETYVRV